MIDISSADSVLLTISSSSATAILIGVWKISQFHSQVKAMQKELEKIQDVQAHQISEDYLSQFKQGCHASLRNEFDNKYNTLYRQLNRQIQSTTIQVAAVNANLQLIMDRMKIKPIQLPEPEDD